MARKCISLLLLALMPANLCLGIGHAHSGSDFAEPGSHGARPHFHLGFHAEHDHGHSHHGEHSHHHHGEPLPQNGQEPGEAFTSQADHDADAIYCGGEIPSVVRKSISTRPVLERQALHAALAPEVAAAVELRLARGLGEPALARGAPCPLYLRHLSLRN